LNILPVGRISILEQDSRPATKNILEILAEPNLMATHGQKSKLPGGWRFPFPIVQPGQGFVAVTIQFSLLVYASILLAQYERQRYSPSRGARVSTLGFFQWPVHQGFNIPAISTRRAETEIELKDGQSFGIAGSWTIGLRFSVQGSWNCGNPGC